MEPVKTTFRGSTTSRPDDVKKSVSTPVGTSNTASTPYCFFMSSQSSFETAITVSKRLHIAFSNLSIFRHCRFRYIFFSGLFCTSKCRFQIIASTLCWKRIEGHDRSRGTLMAGARKSQMTTSKAPLFTSSPICLRISRDSYFLIAYGYRDVRLRSNSA